MTLSAPKAARPKPCPPNVLPTKGPAHPMPCPSKTMFANARPCLPKKTALYKSLTACKALPTYKALPFLKIIC